MDLAEYGRVIRRQALVIGLGLALTLLLVLITLARVTSDGLVLRSPPVYQGLSTLLVSQRGFPWGRSAPPDYQQADTARMEYLAGIYAELATSESVRLTIENDGSHVPLSRKSYDVTQAVAPLSQHPLPLIEVIGKSTSDRQAVAIANRVATGIRNYIRVNQDEGRIPVRERVELQIVTRADKAKVLRGVKLTTPLMIFLLGLVVTLVVAFTRDNAQRNRGDSGSGSPPLEPSVGTAVGLEPVQEESSVHRGRITVPRAAEKR